ncbi:MAG TPA: hypothetical protein VL651_12625 [Bacteroidia bacterium]|jgi:hypothetical protein|nr:hypothetical protein [Bacteroidia bacterium]
MRHFFRCLFLFSAFLFLSSAKHETRNSFQQDAWLTDTVVAQDPLSDLFLGKIRASVKTSFVNDVPDTFHFIQELRGWLPSDLYMHTQSDARTNINVRCKEENKNIYLRDVYIFGVKREDDNDFHVLLGTSGELNNEQLYFSAEISGLPDTASDAYATLKTLRTKFKAHFGNDITKEFVFVASANHPPIHLLSIQGSLFFDNHHYTKHSAVQGRSVCSAWEIHPVTSIEFDEAQ